MNNANIDYLVEYNPGLVALTKNMKHNFPNEATYLLSLRVTSINNCFSTQVYEDLPQDVWHTIYYTSINHLGLDILDAKYQMIPGYDVVIGVDVPLDLKRDTRTGAEDSVSPTFMDYCLFLLNDETYLHTNADTVVVWILSMREKEFDNHNAHAKKNRTCAEVASQGAPSGSWEKPFRLKDIYGDNNLRVTLMRQFNTICNGGVKGKNYALFGLPNTTHPDAPDSVYAEINIFPHRVQRILPNEFHPLTKLQVFEKIWKEGTNNSCWVKMERVNMRVANEVGNTIEIGGGNSQVLPCFSTVDAHKSWFPRDEAPSRRASTAVRAGCPSPPRR